MTKKSAALVVEKIILFWKKAKITAQRKDHVAEKVIKLFTERANLKKNKENKKKPSSQLIENKNNFNKRLDNFFVVAHQNAMELIQIEGYCQFLLYQRDGRQGRMEIIDEKPFEKEIKRNEKILKQQRFAEKNMSKSKEVQWIATVPEYGDESSASSKA